MITWPKNGGANQKWYVEPDGTIRSQMNGMALDISGSSNAECAEIIVWPKHGNLNQQWDLRN